MTLRSIGVQWPITGDDNHDASCSVDYRVQGAPVGVIDTPYDFALQAADGTQPYAWSPAIASPRHAVGAELGCRRSPASASRGALTYVPGTVSAQRDVQLAPGHGGEIS